MFASLLPGAVGIQLPLDQTLSLARQARFHGVAVDIRAAAKLGAAKTGALFEQAALRIGSWALPVQFRADAATFQRDLEAFGPLVRLAERLGADRCVTGIMPCSDELDFAANLDLHVERLEPVARMLGEHGCRLGLEFIGPRTLRAGKKYEFIHDMPGMFELIGAINVPCVGLLLDSFHWFTSGGSADDLESITAADIIDVHVNDGIPGRSANEQVDNERMLPGESGVIDLKSFLSGLKKLGYEGPVSAEPFSKPLAAMPPDQAAAAVATAMKKVWAAAGLHWAGTQG